MMVIKKAHFDNTFGKVLKNIEDMFDKDFERGIFYDLEGSTILDIETFIEKHTTWICESLWDIIEEETIEAYEPLEDYIEVLIIRLLHLYKLAKERKINDRLE